MTGTPPPDVARPDATGPRVGRGARAALVGAIVVLVVVAAYFVADALLRKAAEERASASIEESLPDEVAGEVQVRIDGVSVIWQYLTGAFERVTLSTSGLEVNGSPIDADVVLTGVPTDFEQPVERIVATLSVDEASLNELVPIPDAIGAFVLGDGTISYRGELRVLGQGVEYEVAATPVAAGDEVLLEPESVSLGSGGNSVDLSGLVSSLLGGDPLPVCVAQHLPEGAEVAGITIRPGSADVRIEAAGMTLDEQTFESTGSC